MMLFTCWQDNQAKVSLVVMGNAELYVESVQADNRFPKKREMVVKTKLRQREIIRLLVKRMKREEESGPKFGEHLRTFCLEKMRK